MGVCLGKHKSYSPHKRLGFHLQGYFLQIKGNIVQQSHEEIIQLLTPRTKLKVTYCKRDCYLEQGTRIWEIIFASGAMILPSSFISMIHFNPTNSVIWARIQNTQCVYPNHFSNHLTVLKLSIIALSMLLNSA